MVCRRPMPSSVLGNNRAGATAAMTPASIYISAASSVSLLVEAKRTVYPRDVREVLWQIRRYNDLAASESANEQRLPLIVAELISPGAKELLREEQVGYFDSGGSLFIPARGAYVYIEKPPPKPLAKALRSLFFGRRTASAPRAPYSAAHVGERQRTG